MGVGGGAGGGAGKRQFLGLPQREEALVAAGRAQTGMVSLLKALEFATPKFRGRRLMPGEIVFISFFMSASFLFLLWGFIGVRRHRKRRAKEVRAELRAARRTKMA